jgi:hypothetical protein
MKSISNNSLVYLLVIVAGTSLVSEADSPVRPEIEYRSFKREQVKRFLWMGEHVAFLTVRSDLDPKVMDKLTDTFDKVYEYYKEATGREPSGNRRYQGRLMIAEIRNTCGAGCGLLGAAGIELMPRCFAELYDGVARHDEYDQALPYEFGRNFWFYRRQIATISDKADAGYQDSVVTGYAVFMRFMALEAAGVELGAFRGKSGKEFRKCVEELVDLYVADPNCTWATTLNRGEAPKNALELNGTDLFASFCFRLARDRGGRDYVRQLWREVEKRPAAHSTQDSVDNFILAASSAAGENLTNLFTQTWRWPMSDHAKTTAEQMFAR